jgi:predicted permease
VRVEGYTRGVGEGGDATAFAGLVLVGLCLLLIACANVANLLLIRATDRVRALAVQSALGAGRLQIGGQLLLESLLLAVAGGAVGLALAGGVVAVLERTLAAEHFGYYWMRLAVDGPVLAATAALVAGTALVAGILPVIRVLRVDVQRVLKEEGAGLGVGGGGGWSRAFVTAQLAVSCGAVVVAALTGRSLAATRDFGGDLPSEEVIVAGVGLPAGLDGEDRGALLRTLETSLSTGAGVREVALALAAPGYRERYSPVELRGTAPEPGSFTLWNAVSPDFLASLEIPLRAGRALSRADDAGAARVALVSESFVRRYSPGEPVLGRAVRLSAADSAWFTVVGVVADVELGVGAYSRPDRVLVPLGQVGDTDVMALLRADGPASELGPALRSAVTDVGPDLPIWTVRTLADAHATILRVPRLMAGLAVAAGGVGLLVAGAGLYGLLAFRVRVRRRELALRVALGARGGRLAGDVLFRALGQLLPAVVLGLAVAWIAAPWLQVMLMGAEPRSPGVFGAVGIAFVLAGLGAALLPARGAARVDPATALVGK